jgi:hypothetical protein
VFEAWLQGSEAGEWFGIDQIKGQVAFAIGYRRGTSNTERELYVVAQKWSSPEADVCDQTLLDVVTVEKLALRERRTGTAETALPRLTMEHIKNAAQKWQVLRGRHWGTRTVGTKRAVEDCAGPSGEAKSGEPPVTNNRCELITVLQWKR